MTKIHTIVLNKIFIIDSIALYFVRCQNIFHYSVVHVLPVLVTLWFLVVQRKLERSLLLLELGHRVERFIGFAWVAEYIIESFQLWIYVSYLFSWVLTNVTIKNNLWNSGFCFNSFCLKSVWDCCLVSKSNNFFDSSLNICSFCWFNF